MPALDLTGLLPEVAMGMQQGFAAFHEISLKQSNREEAGNGIVVELARHAAAQNSDLNSKAASQTQILITTKAADALLNGGLAKSILDERSAGTQPQAANGPQPVPPKAP